MNPKKVEAVQKPLNEKEAAQIQETKPILEEEEEEDEEQTKPFSVIQMINDKFKKKEPQTGPLKIKIVKDRSLSKQ